MSSLPPSKGDVLELGAWAEALDAEGNVLGLGKLWPGEHQRLASIRSGLMVQARITTMDGKVYYPRANPVKVALDTQLWLTWNPEF